VHPELLKRHFHIPYPLPPFIAPIPRKRCISA
jgi:hypothetical protein